MSLCSRTLSRVTVSSQGMAAMLGTVSSQAMGTRGTDSKDTDSREATEDSHRAIPMEATNPLATLRKVRAAAICLSSCAQQTTMVSWSCRQLTTKGLILLRKRLERLPYHKKGVESDMYRPGAQDSASVW